MRGVAIGPNVVMDTQSTVTLDVLANAVVGGLHARVLKVIEEYAEKALAQTCEYNRVAYRGDKVRELYQVVRLPW
jgi:hypothetical protein